MKLRLWPSGATIAQLRLRALMRLSDRTTFHGVTIYTPGAGFGAPEAKTAKVRDALDLIRTHDPARLERLREQMPAIVIAGSAGIRGSYHSSLNLCQLYYNWLGEEKTTPVEVAMVLAHEAMHGQLEALGVRMTSGRQFRIERLCMQSSIALGKKLSGSEDALQKARYMQAHAELAWSAERMRELSYRAGQVAIEECRSAGSPMWIVALLERLNRRVHADVLSRMDVSTPPR